MPGKATSTMNEEKTQVRVQGDKASKKLRIFYRVQKMLHPRLLCEENPKYPDEVAVMASFIPNFEPPEPQEELEILEDAEPEFTSHYDQ